MAAPHTPSHHQRTEGMFFQRVGRTRIIPLSLKIILMFTAFLIVSSLSTNYINLILTRGEQVKLLNALLVKDLKELYVFASNQYEIFTFEQNQDASRQALIQGAAATLTRPGALALALRPSGSLFFAAYENETSEDPFTDEASLRLLTEYSARGLEEGSLEFEYRNTAYMGFWKFHPRWQAYFLRAEDKAAFEAESWRIFGLVGLLIAFITLITTVLGIIALRYLFRFVGRITDSLMHMQASQELSVIDMSGAPNDDITYLGLSFNSLSATIKNLMTIFKKFVTQDVAYRAYKERTIRLEGDKRNLTILFTDIRGFTFMTETLGNDIIKLLNLHYDRAIRHIQEEDGIVGSIIGDALLAVYGALDERSRKTKSLQSVRSAYLIQQVAAELREQMEAKRAEILRQRGSLTPLEEDIYKAVLLEVGVGIDGGEVFYGNIGSYIRMTNTVIGDNVNSSSRLEGLTRVYNVPVIVSDYVRQEVLELTDEYIFLELDQVQVKGKTEGKTVFWPLRRFEITPPIERALSFYREALEHYYAGRWPEAFKLFSQADLPPAEVFLDRIRDRSAPGDWNGVWTMKSK